MLDYKEEVLFDAIVHYISNNFEVLVYVTFSVLVSVLLIFIILRLRDISLWLFFRTTFHRGLYIVLMAGQLIAMGLLGYLYWENYQKPVPELILPLDVLASTQWVKDDLRIYFIQDAVLRSVQVDGSRPEEVIKANDPIIEYHFSPDGSSILVLTQKDLFLVETQSRESYHVDTLTRSVSQDPAESIEAMKGSIGGIQWAPDSQKFVYEVARWSKFTSQDNVYVYFLGDRSKKSIKSPARRVSSLYWGKDGENLYYLRHESQDTTEHPSAYEVNVFRISLSTLVPESVVRISYEDRSVPIENLNVRGIDLYLEGSKLSFGRSEREGHLKSPDGKTIGIDEEDYLYFMPSQWFRKRLFKVPRELRVTEIHRYQYGGGDLVIDQIRWLPGNRYVIMEHQYLGVLILEPSTGKVGVLIQANGHTFGWYQS